MRSFARWVSRGYPRLALGLVLVTALSAFGFAARTHRTHRAIAVLGVPGAARPRITRVGRVTYVASPGAPERIVPDTVAPDQGSRARLLWLAGRPASQTTHGSIALDAGGGVVEFDERLQPHRRALAAEGRSVTDVAPAPNGGLWLADDVGHLLQTNDRGNVVHEFVSSFRYPGLGADEHGTRLWLVRSPERFGYAWDSTESALITRVDAHGTVDKTLGRAALPSRMRIFTPNWAFSNPSSYVKHSWSVVMPAAK